MKRWWPVLILWAPLAAADRPQGLAILEQRCLACHNSKVKQSGLDLSARDLLLRGGDRGPALTPGDPETSLLFQAVTHAREPHMPFQAGKLPDAEIAAIAAWIRDGAPFEKPLAAAPAPPPVDHWAFQIPKRPAVPKPPPDAHIQNPIDAFLYAEYKKRNLTPVPEAPPAVLYRRAYLDLLGMPPTREEMRAFLADTEPKAYERAVDKLLADPRYGERWARHWMDVWRYSDWYGWRKGKDVRNSHQYMWRWRDWIVESLNQDKSYARMILEMLAADEIAPADTQTLRATGFLVRNFNKYDRHGWMQDAVDHTAAGFLGVTLKCARCHDHKYDPLAQDEYYRFRAFFEPYEVRIDRVSGQPDTEKDGLSRAYDAEAARVTHLLIRGDIQNPDNEKKIAPGVPHALGGTLGGIESVPLPVDSYYPDHRPFVHQDLLKQAARDVSDAEAALEKAKTAYAAAEKEAQGADPSAALEKLRAPADQLTLARKTLAAARTAIPGLEARIAADNARYSDPPDSKYEELANAARKAEREAGILRADENVFRAQLQFQEALKPPKPGDPADEKKVAEAQKRLAAAQAALTQVAEGYTPVGKVYPDRSSGRRTALARWIASSQNPLTARVAVNHIWLRHFGKALVPTVFDFGLNGKRPTHPELLDWLAVEFMDSGWSMKKLHRLILTSAAYRMRSTAGESSVASAAADPDNVYLWRMNPKRMEAEVVRDSILAVSGQLDRAMGGPEIDETLGFESQRRSLYFRHSPDTQMEFLKMFDAPNPAECYERNESVAPQQALALSNSRLGLEQARVLARKLSEENRGPNSDAAFVKAAFETILSRDPAPKELSASEAFLRRQPGLFGDPDHLSTFQKVAATDSQASPDAALRARENLVHVLFNHNDFVTIR